MAKLTIAKKISSNPEYHQQTLLVELNGQQNKPSQFIVKKWECPPEDAHLLVKRESMKKLLQLEHTHIPKMTRVPGKDAFGFKRTYLPGRTLSEMLCLSPQELQLLNIDRFLANLIEQLLPTLAELSQKGIVHGNITPEHILIGKDDKVYLIGWASGCLIDPDHSLQSLIPNYSDLMGLGLSILAFITQSEINESILSTRGSIQFQQSVKVPGIKPELKGWLKRLIHPRPEKRFQDATTALEYFTQIKEKGICFPDPYRERQTFFSKILVGLSVCAAILLGSLYQEQLWLFRYSSLVWEEKMEVLDQELHQYYQQHNSKIQKIDEDIARYETGFDLSFENLEPLAKDETKEVKANFYSFFNQTSQERETMLADWESRSQSSLPLEIQSKERELRSLADDDLIDKLVLKEVNRTMGSPKKCLWVIPEFVCRGERNERRRALETDSVLRLQVIDEIKENERQIESEIEVLEAELLQEKEAIQAIINHEFNQRLATLKPVLLEQRQQKIAEISAQRPQLSVIIAETQEEFATSAKVWKFVGVVIGAGLGVSLGAVSFLLLINWNRGKQSQYFAIAAIGTMIVTAGVTVLVDVSFSEVVVVGVGIPALFTGTTTGLCLVFTSSMANQFFAEYKLMKEYEVK